MPMNARLLRPLASGAFTPKQISGLVGWWDASDAATVTTVSGDVSQIDDKSGLGRHATQATAASRPAYTGAINGRNVMTMNGTSDFLITGLESATLTGYATMFCVAQISSSLTPTTANNKTPLFGRDPGATNSYGIVMNNAAAGFGVNTQWRNAGYNYINPPPVSIGSPQMFAVAFEAAGRTRRANGSGDFYAAATTAGTNSAAGNYLHIGLDPTQNRYWTDLWGEALVFDRDLTDAEIQKIEGYLAWKWGLQAQLPYDHPYAKSFPGFGSQATPTDADALTYLAAVKAADGTGVEVGVANAVDAFVTGCKADGIWDAIKASCILAGARTLAGALVPLKGAAPTNNNFVSGDYNRETGLVGNGSTKYLDSNFNRLEVGQDDCHAALFVKEAPTGNFGRALGCGDSNSGSGTGQTRMLRGGNASDTLFSHGNASNTTANTSGLLNFAGLNRGSSAEYDYRINSVTGTVSNTSEARQNLTFFVFQANPISTGSNARIAFYSMGEALSLADLDTRVTALITAIGNAI